MTLLELRLADVSLSAVKDKPHYSASLLCSIIVFSAKLINDLSLYSSRRRGNCSATLAQLSEVCNEKKDRANEAATGTKDWTEHSSDEILLFQHSGNHRDNTKRQRESWHCCSSTTAWDHLVERDNIESLTKTAVWHTWPILDQCPRGQIEDYVQRHSWEKHPDLSLPSMIFLKDHKLNEKRRGLQIQARARAHNDVPSHSLSQKTHEICSWVSRALSPIWPVIQWKTHMIHTVKARAEQNGDDGKYGAR